MGSYTNVVVTMSGKIFNCSNIRIQNTKLSECTNILQLITENEIISESVLNCEYNKLHKFYEDCAQEESNSSSECYNRINSTNNLDSVTQFILAKKACIWIGCVLISFHAGTQFNFSQLKRSIGILTVFVAMVSQLLILPFLVYTITMLLESYTSITGYQKLSACIISCSCWLHADGHLFSISQIFNGFVLPLVMNFYVPVFLLREHSFGISIQLLSNLAVIKVAATLSAAIILGCFARYFKQCTEIAEALLKIGVLLTVTGIILNYEFSLYELYALLRISPLGIVPAVGSFLVNMCSSGLIKLVETWGCYVGSHERVTVKSSGAQNLALPVLLFALNYSCGIVVKELFSAAIIFGLGQYFSGFVTEVLVNLKGKKKQDKCDGEQVVVRVDRSLTILSQKSSMMGDTNKIQDV